MFHLTPGRGKCRVQMLNTGWLPPSTINKWIETAQREAVKMPVMSFVLEHNNDIIIWDLGLPSDLLAVGDGIQAGWRGKTPISERPMPESLTGEQMKRLRAIYLSHHHWDHCGDITTVPTHIPVYVGPGCSDKLRGGDFDGLGRFVGDTRAEVLNRLQDAVGQRVYVELFGSSGVDVFGDGSFVLLPGPGHCEGHSIALVRTTIEPDTYMILGGDCGHNRALYSACLCHGRVAHLSTSSPIHQNEKVALETLETLARMSQNEAVWVLLAHEAEAIGQVPERRDLSDWKDLGYKERVYEEMIAGRRKWCYAEEYET